METPPQLVMRTLRDLSQPSSAALGAYSTSTCYHKAIRITGRGRRMVVLISAYPGQLMPYGLDKFETDALLNLTASVSPTHVPFLQEVQLR